MAEYIEREAAYEKCGWYNTVNGKSVCAVRKDELAAIPAADVVAVVRCRDCKHENVHRAISDKCTWCEYWGIDPDFDDFCSYGEKSGNNATEGY